MENLKGQVLSQENGQPDFTRGSIRFIGTATILLNYAGFTILTDPNFLHQGDKVHIGYGLQSTRLTNPAINIEELPPLDLVLLSHMHEDHFDRLVARKLDKTLPIITTPQAAADLKKKGFDAAQALETWQSRTFNKGTAQLRITSMPGKHGPGLLSLALPQVMGSMLEFQTPGGKTPLRVYITGDTLLVQDLREIPRRYPEIDLALLHLGGTKVFGIMLTMDGKQGVEVLKIMAPETAIPIHYNDYTVFKSPLKDFKQAVNAADLAQHVHYLNHGETYNFEVPQDRIAGQA